MALASSGRGFAARGDRSGPPIEIGDISIHLGIERNGALPGRACGYITPHSPAAASATRNWAALRLHDDLDDDLDVLAGRHEKAQ